MGFAHYQLGKAEEAIISYNLALKVRSDYPEAYYYIGIALHQLGKTEEELKAYDRALEIKPSYIEAWNGRGIALIRLGRFEDAITSYDRALSFNPNDDSVIYNKACACSLNQQADFAIQYLRQAIQLNSTKYQEMAKTDTDFDNICNDPRFIILVNQ
jgi:tetratricopeptide (TPR) repeat protein